MRRRAPRTRRTGRVLAISPSPTSASPPPRRDGLVAAFGYAFAGFAAAWREQPNLRIHAGLAALVVAAAAVLRIPPLWWAPLVLAIGLVAVAELLNTAIEAAVDLVTLDDHPLARRAKDVAAAGVLVAALTALGVALSLAVALAVRH